MNLLPLFRKHLSDQSLIKPGEALVVGVSGGIDSVVLLDLLDRLRSSMNLRVVVAHLNHNLRGRESRRDADLVRRLAEEKGLVCEIRTLPRKTFAKKGNLQEKARDLRYAFFEKVAKEHGAKKLVTAHQADDQVETFFMRLIRGTGVEGLKGMASDRPLKREALMSLVRPLLPFSRDQILGYARKRGLSWREDSSNAKEDYLRNRIRLRLIPEMKAQNPRAIEKISEALNILRQEEVWWEDWIERRVNPRIRRSNTGFSLPLPWLLKQFPSVRYRIYRRMIALSPLGLLGIQRRHLDFMEQMVIKQNERARVTLPRGYGAFLSEKSLVIRKWSGPQRPKKRGFFC
jgi:tRNA(Ile)-lysidine synthase